MVTVIPFLLSLFVARPEAGPCPAPTVARGGSCVLLADHALSATLELGSRDLNCHGHRLTPVARGVNDDPRTVANEFRPSSPEAAAFVLHATGARIINCVFEGFDFGVIVVASERTHLVGNVIDVRSFGVELMGSQDGLLADNDITFHAERGRGVGVYFASRDNRIVGNRVVSTDLASTGHIRRMPGIDFFNTQTAIMDNEVHILGGDRTLLNVVVNGVLHQFVSADRALAPEDQPRTERNLVEDNTFSDIGVGTSCTFEPAIACRTNAECPTGKGPCLLKQNSGTGFNIRASDNIVRGNHYQGQMSRGVSFGGVPAPATLSDWFPGHCSGDASRLCLANSDCLLAGYEASSRGTCVDIGAVTFNGNTMRNVAEDNTFDGSFPSAALFANNSDGFVFRGNTVVRGAIGVIVSNLAFRGTVERNVVTGVARALVLGFRAPFDHAILLNDFEGTEAAVVVSPGWNVATDISGDYGNWYGVSCSGQLVVYDDSAALVPNPLVTASKRYGVPVATTPIAELPPLCPE